MVALPQLRVNDEPSIGILIPFSPCTKAAERASMETQTVCMDVFAPVKRALTRIRPLCMQTYFATISAPILSIAWVGRNPGWSPFLTITAYPPGSVFTIRQTRLSPGLKPEPSPPSDTPLPPAAVLSCWYSVILAFGVLRLGIRPFSDLYSSYRMSEPGKWCTGSSSIARNEKRLTLLN